MAQNKPDGNDWPLGSKRPGNWLQPVLCPLQSDLEASLPKRPRFGTPNIIISTEPQDREPRQGSTSSSSHSSSLIFPDKDDSSKSTVSSTPESICNEEPIDRDFDTCFGMVEIDSPALRLEILGDVKQGLIHVTLSIEGRMVTVRHPHSREYGGRLKRDPASALTEIFEKHETTFQAFIHVKRFKKGEDPDGNLFVMIYGMKEQGSAIGKILDGAELFLQHPHFVDPSATYSNPHYLCRPGSSVSLPDTPLILSSLGSAKILTENDPLKRQVLDVFDSCQGPQVYSLTSPSPRLCTPLKPHQSKALSMMIEKESGRLQNHEFGALWARIDHRDGVSRYRNMVTGSTQINEPQILLGGLLADEMGLGKTLSMIALITSSLDSIARYKANMLLSHSSLNRTTLIVTPLPLLQEWEEQIQRHTHPGTVAYYVYHGPNRKDVTELMCYDIVLTTYDTLIADETRRSESSAKDETLRSREWSRIVLDEAHVIRNKSSKRFRAARALKGRCRWCLTGTPIYNRVEDFGSLLAFLGASPFDETSTFASYISTPLRNNTDHGFRNLRKLVQAVSLRRTKSSVLEQLYLPPRKTLTNYVHFSPQERSKYNILKSSYASILNYDHWDHQQPKSTGCIFQYISNLRRFCDHGLYLLPKHVLEIFDAPFDKDNLTRHHLDVAERCGPCKTNISVNLENPMDTPSLECGHSLCSRCERKNDEDDFLSTLACQLCVESMASTPQPLSGSGLAIDEVYAPSSKVLALLNNIQAEHTNESGRKPIKRLNLTAASRVHLMEPQWSPMAEEQAFSRVHRMGQTQEVIAARYVVKDSIEEYVLGVQKYKSTIIDKSLQVEGHANFDTVRERLKKYLNAS
ncbi:SNF2 family N-terminal domain-containing protein [Mariannaea sp. PMI_226]|nr:SNF2 family N-terminal domain-containing protein [Mariannaea sp. PMI_226]